ncbi:hypothetical protein QMO56_04615 [Roseomonas sp. E05]|uniref:hypothetical protein n=1 Tax=Roseomonas sp. E05 TaxID=3046310 RepID=UPI0024B909BA|nr:hypothetical protein [Roseomonas sp. E05]MDJ0387387.1 hypothetical protein [Roseomonas sp. E05]
MSLLVRDLYHSANGDRWQLMREAGSERVFVRHQGNLSSGGHVTELTVEDFLRPGSAGPEHVALRRFLDTEAEEG